MITIQECNAEVRQAADMLAENERSRVYTSRASIDHERRGLIRHRRFWQRQRRLERWDRTLALIDMAERELAQAARVRAMGNRRC